MVLADQFVARIFAQPDELIVDMDDAPVGICNRNNAEVIDRRSESLSSPRRLRKIGRCEICAVLGGQLKRWMLVRRD